MTRVCEGCSETRACNREVQRRREKSEGTESESDIDGRGSPSTDLTLCEESLISQRGVHGRFSEHIPGGVEYHQNHCESDEAMRRKETADEERTSRFERGP
jgi:hypothetical protein